MKSLSRVRLLATPWTAAHQASPSMGFSRQESWSGVPLPSPVQLLMASYLFSHARPSATPWTAAHQASLSMGFSRQEYWNGVPLPSLFHGLDDFKKHRSVIWRSFLNLDFFFFFGCFLMIRFMVALLEETSEKRGCVPLGASYQVACAVSVSRHWRSSL